MSTSPTYLILGAGAFGTSAAYHLSKTSPSSKITIVDRHAHPASDAFPSNNAGHGASYDLNKIVRADYSVPFYMALGHEAIDAWSSWEVLRPFYHRTGWVQVEERGSDLAERIRRNFKDCGREDVTRDMSLEEVRRAWRGVLEGADLGGMKSAYWNPSAGWVEAERAVNAVLEEAVRGGVEYISGEVVEVLLRDGGQGVKGVRLADGRVLEVEKVLLATGAWTSKLMTGLEDRLGFNDKMRVESQVKAAGVAVTHWILNEEEQTKFAEMPVIIWGSNGDLQPLPRSNLVKMAYAKSFFNTTTTPSGHKISVPPDGSQYSAPESLEKEAVAVVAKIFPNFPANGRKPCHLRLCWDSITPSQHQVITRHPSNKLDNLYLAIGGSFHSWKFLPTIGKYITNALLGKSNGEEKDKNWAWKDHGWQDGVLKGAHEKAVPHCELSDFY